MRIAVVGCGAMGSIYAALLASSGNEVLAIDRDAEHVRVIRERGLRVSGASGDRTVRVRAACEAPDEEMDLVVLAVKAAHVSDAAEAARRLVGPGTRVLTIQNGLGSAEAVAGILGAERLIVGVAQGFGAALVAPGHATHEDMKAIRMGAHGDLPQTAVVEIAALWRTAGFDAEAVRDITAMQWDKLIRNVAYSALCALTGRTVGEVRNDPDLGAIAGAAATEAWSVARALGIAISVEDPVAAIHEFADRMPDAKPSALLDVLAGRRSEVDVINGAVPRQAEKAGLAAPVNETLAGLVRERERRGSGASCDR